MKILVQFGNKGTSVLNHLIRPLAQAKNVIKVILVCRHPGPMIPKVEYYCPPIFIARFPFLAVIYEFLTLFILTVIRRPGCILGYLLFPHGLMAFIVALATGRPCILSLIAGPVELYAIGSPLGVEFTKPIPWVGRITLKMLNYCAFVTTTGTFTKGFLVNHGLIDEKIYTMINPPDYARINLTDIPKIYDIVAVGRLVPVKHIEVLLHSAKKVKEVYKDIKVCIVGDGPCKAALRNLTEDLGLNDNVEFVGFQKDVGYYYNSSKIFVLTSEREGFPNVFLEAMMCGLPSVVSTCGDITDLARDGYNCILIQRYNDCEGFADAITRLLKDASLYYTLSKNALDTVSYLSAQEVTRKWELLLDTFN